ncbi:MAG: histidine phosphatase family protein [Lachnospiraceae bacterium]|nr:histidine phosphatase family protein [Lachnospiraceae bacterium]
MQWSDIGGQRIERNDQTLEVSGKGVGRLEILLLRHGKTQGNLERRYVGRTDEPLLASAAAELARSEYRDFGPELVCASPMLRCRQTAEILFPECRLVICGGLRETDFGAFEYKTYGDLKDNPAYQAWIDSGGTAAASGGESGMDFRMRCRRAFLACLRRAEMRGAQKIAFVTHGGVIMAVMEAFARPRADFYSWHLPNGSAYRVCAMKGDSTWFLENL